ncbi:hypothetical protein C8R44DRAFT_744932 [Mycena epipterygia]|nr:hypothetical protein C8R44DRAFT_744932 [Mycena epipterygia]
MALQAASHALLSCLASSWINWLQVGFVCLDFEVLRFKNMPRNSKGGEEDERNPIQSAELGGGSSSRILKKERQQEKSNPIRGAWRLILKKERQQERFNPIRGACHQCGLGLGC